MQYGCMQPYTACAGLDCWSVADRLLGLKHCRPIRLASLFQSKPSVADRPMPCCLASTQKPCQTHRQVTVPFTSACVLHYSTGTQDRAGQGIGRALAGHGQGTYDCRLELCQLTCLTLHCQSNLSEHHATTCYRRLSLSLCVADAAGAADANVAALLIRGGLVLHPYKYLRCDACHDLHCDFSYTLSSTGCKAFNFLNKLCDFD